MIHFMKRILFLLFMSAATCLTAALSPINQSINEIDSILHHRELIEKLGQNEVILDILRTEEGYNISTEHYDMIVELVYETKRNIGPRTYKLLFHTPAPKEEIN